MIHFSAGSGNERASRCGQFKGPILCKIAFMLCQSYMAWPLGELPESVKNPPLLLLLQPAFKKCVCVCLADRVFPVCVLKIKVPFFLYIFLVRATTVPKLHSATSEAKTLAYGELKVSLAVYNENQFTVTLHGIALQSLLKQKVKYYELKKQVLKQRKLLYEKKHGNFDDLFFFFEKTSEAKRAARRLKPQSGAKQTFTSRVRRKCSGVDEMFERGGASRSLWPRNCTGQMRHLQCDDVGLMSQNSPRLQPQYFFFLFFVVVAVRSLYLWRLDKFVKRLLSKNAR